MTVFKSRWGFPNSFPQRANAGVSLQVQAEQGRDRVGALKGDINRKGEQYENNIPKRPDSEN